MVAMISCYASRIKSMCLSLHRCYFHGPASLACSLLQLSQHPGLLHVTEHLWPYPSFHLYLASSALLAIVNKHHSFNPISTLMASHHAPTMY